MTKLVDKGLCPLCNSTNACALESGASIEHCWCIDQDFPDKEELDLNLENQACLCQECVKRLLKLASLQVKEIV